MSSLLVCAQPATGLPGVFVPKESPALLIKKLSAVPRLTPVAPASRMEVRPAPDIASSVVAALDTLTGGLPRGCLSEICGPASSGRTSVLMAALAAATRRGEACALVDASNAFDPQSGAAAGMQFRNLLWVRCNENENPPRRHPSTSLWAGFDTEKSKNKAQFDCLDQALKATDLLLQSGGFGLVAIDLGDVPVPTARRIPLTSWFRFRRAVENTPTVLLVMARGSCARTCASLVVELHSSVLSRESSGKSSALTWQLSEKHGEIVSATDSHGLTRVGSTSIYENSWQILTGMEVTAEVLRSRLERKPTQSEKACFTTKAQALYQGTALAVP